MPFSLLNQINPVTLHVFYVSLLKVMGIGLLAVVLGGIWSWRRSGRQNASQARHLEIMRLGYPKGYHILSWGLGLLWIIDGLLQAQPPMATSMFVDMDVAANLSSQPHWLVVLLGAGIQAWTTHQITSAVFSVIIQVFIGLAILLGAERRLGRIGLYVSLVWSIPVWIYGEGLGDVFTGKASWLLGSPGAVVFYVLGAVWLLLPPRFWKSGQVSRWTRYWAAGLWLFLAGWQALPGAGYWSSTGLFHIFRNNAFMPQPEVLLAPIVWIMGISRLHPVFINGIMVAIMAYLGVSLLAKKTGRLFWMITVLWLLASWWLGQDFGIVGGVGTDPQSAPLFLLLILGGWYYAHSVEKESANRPKRAYPKQNLQVLGLAAAGVLTTVFLAFGFVIPQVVVAQGDHPAPRIQSKRVEKAPSVSEQKSVAVSHLIPTSRWMQYNAAKRQVQLLLQASVNTFGSLAFDGYANGFLTITIPQGWTVDVSFVNEQSILKNSAMIVPLSQLKQGGPFTSAFPGASSPHPTQGVARGVVQHFQFVASRSGRYAVVSAVPDGQSSSGMWDNVVVKNVTKPTIRVK